MTYLEAVDYLNSFVDYERIPQYAYRQALKLERIKEFLQRLGNPQDDLKCIHIAGTKGKGSTCAFIAYILREAQLKVGLYTSPHLSDFRERIRILNPGSSACPRSDISHSPQLKEDYEGMISCERLISLIERLKPEIEKFNSQSKYGPLSFFEVYTSLAFIYFKQEKVDFLVSETGLGGRLDATNTVSSIIAAISPISYEHTKQLGRTLAEITQEKVGIIKGHRSQVTGHRSIVISAPQEKEVIEVIRNRCKQMGTSLYEIGKDIIFEREQFLQDGQGFKINGTLGRLTDLKIRLLGRHQVTNAALAVAVVLALSKFYQVEVDAEIIRSGLCSTIWPGRFEIVSKSPLIVLDGVQNVSSAQVLKEAIIENFPDKRIILILGISQDKDIKGISEVLIPMSDEVILTQANNPRATDVDVIEQIVGCQLIKTKGVREAIEIAKRSARSEDLILVTGSLFIVGEAREIQTEDPLLKISPK